METRHTEHVREMEHRLRFAPGSLDQPTREAALRGRPLDDPLAEAYLRKVRLHAYKITDEEVERLRGGGWSEDQIFELTVAAAYGAGRRRLDAGLAALAGALARREAPAMEGTG